MCFDECASSQVEAVAGRVKKVHCPSLQYAEPAGVKQAIFEALVSEAFSGLCEESLVLLCFQERSLGTRTYLRFKEEVLCFPGRGKNMSQSLRLWSLTRTGHIGEPGICDIGST